MTDITITGRVAERLQRLAEDRHRTVEEVLEDVLDTMAQQEDKDTAGIEPPPGTFARMAWVAMQNPIELEATDVADRSRDILQNEYADYLLKRQTSSNGETHESNSGR
jgi:hypothetical protein